MPRIFDNIELPLLPALRDTLAVSQRAEQDGLVAHLYELTEDEFTHILSTFPLVEAGVKDAALAAFHKHASGAR